MERREATEQNRTEQIDTSSRFGNLMLYITFFVEKKHHRVLLLLVVVYTQANKKARKKERKGVGHVWIPCLCLQCTEWRNRTSSSCSSSSDDDFDFVMGGRSCQPQPQPSPQSEFSCCVHLFCSNFFFFWAAAAAAARIYGNPSGDYPNFELFCVGGTVATKRGFRQCAPRDFPLRWYANDARRRASRWDPTTHLYHIICVVLLTGLYKLFGNNYSWKASS